MQKEQQLLFEHSEITITKHSHAADHVDILDEQRRENTLSVTVQHVIHAGRLYIAVYRLNAINVSLYLSLTAPAYRPG
jgi:stalled ribosome rescue protein Dom34